MIDQSQGRYIAHHLAETDTQRPTRGGTYGCKGSANPSGDDETGTATAPDCQRERAAQQEDTEAMVRLGREEHLQVQDDRWHNQPTPRLDREDRFMHTCSDSELDITEWSIRFHLLGDATRLRLLTAMHHAGPGAATVTELAEAAEITKTAASQALRVLRLQGWVRDERVGRTVRYTLVDATVHQLLHLMGATHD